MGKYREVCMDSYSENENQNVTKIIQEFPFPNGRNRMIKVNSWERVPELWKSVEIQMKCNVGFTEGMYQLQVS